MNFKPYEKTEETFDDLMEEAEDEHRNKSKKPNNQKIPLFGKIQDGEYFGVIEDIGLGIKLFKDKEDVLYISNGRPNFFPYSLFVGYRQLGKFKISKPHSYKEGDFVKCKIKNDKIIQIEKTKLEKQI